MIVSEDFLRKLRTLFDLNIYEVKIWSALLSRGVATAGELADISGVPRSRSYDVLESLEKRGFVLMKLGKPIKYLAVKPEEVIKRSQRRVEDEAKERLQMLEKVKERPIYEELRLLHKHGIEKVEPTDLSGAIKGRKNVYDHIKEALSNAEKTITMSTTTKGLTRKIEALKPTLKKAAERGVKIRIVAPINDINLVPEEIKKIAEIRSIEKEAGRFVVVDGKQLVFMMTDDENTHESYDLGVWVNTPFFANALEQMFNASWQKLPKLH
ncbi:TrmB family transcriptional regulator [Candidatus Woesearchaeota archaeon]|nr:TrmB family transcriptional regulator [Candidatus Woesearchaeota archaeon]